MVKTFRFEEGGRTYSCSIEQARPPRNEAWWWFVVSGDENRYAPFRAVAGDTQESVRTRVVGFYTDRLASRAAPPVQRGFGRRPGTNGAAAGAAPTAAPGKPETSPAEA